VQSSAVIVKIEQQPHFARRQRLGGFDLVLLATTTLGAPLGGRSLNIGGGATLRQSISVIGGCSGG
jgi:hypothetical protein